MRYLYIFSVLLNLLNISTAIAQDNSPETGCKDGDKECEDGIFRYLSDDTSFTEIDDDFLVPSSPAFAVLGISPENVVRPTQPKAFGAALLNGVDPSGTLQTGIAIEGSLLSLFSSRKISLTDYRKNARKRWLARSQISFATTQASSDDDEALRMALGLRVVILDKGDVRFGKNFEDAVGRNLSETLDGQLNAIKIDLRRAADHVQCRYDVENGQFTVSTYLQAVRENSCPPIFDEVKLELETKYKSSDEITKENQDLYDLVFENIPEKDANEAEANTLLVKEEAAKLWKAEVDKFHASAWNASNITLGTAITLESETGSYNDFGNTGFAFYATGAYGFGDVKMFDLQDNAHFITHLRYQTNQLVTATEDDVDPYTQDLLTIGTQFRIRGPNFNSQSPGRTVTFFGEFNYMLADPEGMDSDSSIRYAAGLDIPLTKQASLQFSIGQEEGSDLKTDSSFALGDIKWAF